jgi:hypothetical protein
MEQIVCNLGTKHMPSKKAPMQHLLPERTLQDRQKSKTHSIEAISTHL